MAEAKKPTKAEMRAAIMLETEKIIREQREEILKRARKRLKLDKGA